jgi:drug/metabolite transporter (DMT)-like permease
VTQSLLFGLAAAICWGVSDYAAAVIGRRGGAFPVLLTAHAGAVVVLTLVVPVAPGAGLSEGALLAALAVGPLAVATFVCLFRALEIGPLAVVSPIVSAWSVVTLALALILLGESLGVAESIGCALLLGGVLLGTAGSGGDGARDARARAGVIFAVGTMVFLGAHNFILGHLSEDAGWFWPLYVSRASSVAIMLVIATSTGQWPWRRLQRRDLVLAVAVPGMVSSLGTMAFNRGAEVGTISIAAAASSIYPLVAVALGVVLLREHMARRQLIALAAIFAGLLVLGAAA